MKALSFIIIIVYLLLPLACFGHPCETVSSEPPHVVVAADPSDASPVDLETDYCETTCCCAGHLPLPRFTGIAPLDNISGRYAYEPSLSLPLILDRIFVPPKRYPFPLA
jgi:hypothetical protein